MKIEKFTDLIAWKESHKLVLLAYPIIDSFPRKEYSLIDQMKRCLVSISSNIAEGFSRNSRKEKQQFYFIARGSLTEFQNQILIAKDLKFLSGEQFSHIANQTIIAHKLIHGLLKTAVTK